MQGSDLLIIFSKNLKKYTKDKFKSISKASDKLGISHQQYFQWLDGKRLPRPQNLCDLAELLDVTVADFFKE